jgi:predicted O-linked N-acetylglucosamine transferase (SPINDLY family)
MRRADVFLDPIGFSGFNTAIQAVECGLPIVTREGRFMRGRLASGILDRMGLSDLVARNEEDYIEFAVKLASDAAYRQEVRARMEQARPILYNDLEPVRALEAFLEKVAGNSRLPHVRRF